MKWYMILMIFVILLGAFTLAYQVYKLTSIDARCRGLKHPKLWGLFSLSGNNGSGGLILYLIARRKYPLQITETEQAEMNSRKKRAGVSLIFIAIGTIILTVCLVLGGC